MKPNHRLLEEMALKLLKDQYRDPEHPWFGLFGATRADKVSKPTENPAEAIKRADMTMTRWAVSALQMLHTDVSDTALRLVYKHVDEHLERYRAYKYAGEADTHDLGGCDTQMVTDYRHSITAAHILLIGERRQDLIDQIYTMLLNDDVQLENGGWPKNVRMRNDNQAEFWTSVFALMFLFSYANTYGHSENGELKTRGFIDRTASYVFSNYERNGGFWLRDVVSDDKAGFFRIFDSAATYLDLFPFLLSEDHPLLMEVPEKLAMLVGDDGSFCPPKYEMGSGANMNYNLSAIVAHALLKAAENNKRFADPYLALKKSILNAFSESRPFNTAGLRSLVFILCDYKIDATSYKEAILDAVGRVAKNMPGKAGEIVKLSDTLKDELTELYQLRKG